MPSYSMLQELLILFFLTFVPALELRASIPLGILAGRVELPFEWYLQGFGLHWSIVFLVCVSANALVGPFAYFMFDKVEHLLLRIPGINRLYKWKIEKTQKKIAPLVQKYGGLGIALFIAVPLPGTGSYSAALGALLIGMKQRLFFWADLVGVILQGIIVTILTLTAGAIW